MNTQSTTSHQVTLSRGNSGSGPLEAVTKIPLGFDRRELHITTSKRSFRPGISCHARVVQISPDGHFASFAMGLGSRGGDFSRQLAQAENARATEKNILALHEEGIGTLEQVIVEATSHYAKKTAPAV